MYIDGYEYANLARLIKSVTFFRFFLVLVVIYLLSQLYILDFKYFLVSAAFFPILVSLDVIFQYFAGFNIIGLENFDKYMDNSPIPGSGGKFNTSFFGDEKIAGVFINNFSFFSILFLFFKLKNRKNVRFILTTGAICVLGLGILLSGNRMPLFLFFFGLFLLLSFNLKKIITVSFICLYIIFSYIFSIDEERSKYFKNFYNNLTDTRMFDEPKRPLEEKKRIVVDDFEFYWIKADTVGGHTKLILTALDILEEKQNIWKWN